MKNLNIGKKIAVVFGIVLVMVTAITAVGVWELNKVVASTRQLMAVPLTKERLVSDWYNVIYGGARRTLAIAASSDTSLVKFFADDQAQGVKDVKEVIEKVQPLLDSDEEKRFVKDIFEVRNAYNTTRETIAKTKAAGDTDAANKLLNEKFLPISKDYQTKLRALVEMQRKAIDAEAQKIEDAGALGLRLQGALSVFLALLVIGVGFLLRNSIVGPLHEAIAIARRVSKGDLTADIVVRSKDEAGQLLEALRDMNEELRGLVTHVITGAGHIAGASDEIASGNLELSSRTEQQASSLEETASSMEELTSTVKQTSDNARQANQLAGSASDVAARGGVVVRQVIETMGLIDTSSKKIVDIISVIDGIAFQTNILALNAAVEAARAGEQGRGFAVVAGEVRNLAQRSAAAAKEIKGLIDASVTNVEAGSTLVSEAGTTMEEIVDSIRRVADIMGEISAATREQTLGIEQINEAVAQMDQTTQQNASLVEEAAAASETLQHQAADLAEAVRVFQLKDMPPARVAGQPRAVAPVRKALAGPRGMPAGAATSKSKPKSTSEPVLAESGWETF
jgi:methyl-accepting chemotaxis protein